MFDLVTRHKKWIMIALLVLIIPPFAIFGMDVYFRDVVQPNTLARVGDYSITEEEFSQALRERQLALQRAMQGQRIDPEMLDSPQLRQSLLESLIQRRLLIQAAVDSGLVVPDGHLMATIGQMEVFKDENGGFSYDRYVQYLRSEGMTPAIFEGRLRQDMLISQLAEGLAQSSFVSRTESELLVKRITQERELSRATITAEAYLPKVKLEPDAAKRYYEANPAEFRVPEQVRVEYVTLSVDTLMPQVEVTEEELKQYYEGNRRQFGVEETRSASHILLAVDPSAGPDAKQKALEKAQSIHRELQKNPEGFAAAAKQHSQDPGSAGKGGDLGSRISRGSMKDTPQLEQAIFELKPGEISPPVETQYGYHIVKVTAIEPSKVKPFDEVRQQIEQDLRKQKAARRFAELAEQFSNTVYEQSESLKPAAELVKAAPKMSGWITREGGEPGLDHPRMLEAIFSEEVLKDQRNSQAVEAGPGRLVSARIVEHKPAAQQPFDEVRAGLEKKLALREAARLAAEEGRRLLEALRKGQNPQVDWDKPQVVTREETRDMPLNVLRQAFRMDVSTLPAYSGLETPQGFELLRVTRAQLPEKMPPEREKEIAEQLGGVRAQETLTAYVESLRRKIGVEIFKDRLVKNP